MLRCCDNSLYTGWTNDLNKRVQRHQAGKGAKYTKSRLPVKLVYFESYPSKIKAMRREYAIKQLRKKQKEKLIDIFERSKEMELIDSFQIDHIKLEPGLYISRKDQVKGEVLTTFDIRITNPNEEPVMTTAAIHAIEHLGATYLRNEIDEKYGVIYFGPMGCRTGFYLILQGDLTSSDIVDLIKEMAEFIINFNGEIPGAHPKECGNYQDMNLNSGRYYMEKYYEEVLRKPKKRQLVYP